MNKVSFLLINKFTQFCVEDQLKIKALGRDTPDLNITKATQSDKINRSRKFNPVLYNKSNWICGCAITNKMYCFPCVLYGGDEHWSEKGVDDLIHIWEKIKSHERSPRHLHNMFSLNMLGKVDIKILLNSSLRAELLKQNEQVRQNRHDLDKIISSIRFCGAFELALRGQEASQNSFKELINFTDELFKENRELIEKFPFFKDISLNILQELLECIFGVYKEEIMKQIKSAEYLSVILDESNDISCKCQLVMIVRYLFNGKPVEHFWNILHPETCDAEGVSRSVLQELEVLIGQNQEKLVSVSYDGPSIVSGSLGLIPDKIKEKYPSARYVHYYGHSMNLIISSAASVNKQARIFFSSLCSICSFISNSPQVTNILNELVQKRRNSNVAQWDFDASGLGVKTIHEYRRDLVMVMDFLEKSANDATVNQAGGYKFRLQDKHFIFWLGIFNKIIPHVVSVFNYMQKEGIDAYKKNEELKRFENALYGIQQQIDVLISEVENEINSNPDFDDDEDEHVAKKPKILNRDKRKEEAMEICNAIVRHVTSRFTSLDYLNATNLFRVGSFKEYRMSFPSKFLDDTIKQFRFLDKQKITNELQVVYERPELRVISGVVPLLALVSDADLESAFQELIKLLSVLSTMPIETTEAERCFSVLKQIKTFLTNSARASDLNALCAMSVEKDFLNDIDDFNHKVINLFATKKKRLEFVFRKV
ncbi:zinc finger MYM-type protein 1-like [Euwallacea similis]|uniref:zinc finger MYM-type protein 1-like n=1 Tax=Euwallacea similis TaxID=1736056 RepID=UPI00344F42A7